MTYPAWFDFHRHAAMRKSPACGAVYASLLGLENIFFEPRPVKIWVLAEALRIKKATAIRALDALVLNGFLIEHARDEKNVRRFTVALTIKGSVAPERTHPSAA